MKDIFSKQAEGYAKYRPDYPQALFDFVLSHVRNTEAAWDCATGNGQTAKVLSRYFQKVYATDISKKQLDQAVQAENITYSVQPAEKTAFPDDYFDLITVSQALHWLKHEPFYTEVRRVARPGKWIAVWMYDLLRISEDIDSIIHAFYAGTLQEYWDAERKHVDDHYASIPFPFEEITCPLFRMEYDWTIGELEGYLNTWSAIQKFIEKNNHNPVDALIEKIRPFWTAEKLSIHFPVYLRMGKILK